MTQCKAKSKRTHVQCQANAMKGKNVCYHHGGMSPGAKKNNAYAKTHGAYSGVFSAAEELVIIEEQKALDKLDDDITKNAVMIHRGFTLSNDKQHSELGLKLAGESLSRARKLKMSRQELQRAKDSDDNKPLPWQD